MTEKIHLKTDKQVNLTHNPDFGRIYIIK